MSALIAFVAIGGVAAAALAVEPAPETLRTAIDARHGPMAWVEAATLAEWMEAHERGERPLALFDVRTTEEFAVSHLRGAARVEPGSPLPATPAGARVVVYCSVGYRSGEAAARRPGAFNLLGGIFAWANAGRPMVARGRLATRVHPFDRTWGRYLEPERRAPLP